jgi:Clostripain family.
MDKTGSKADLGHRSNAGGKAKWTVMVYMAGDNNLDGAALRDIKEMAQAGSTEDVHILVQLDRLEDKKTRRFRITKGDGYNKDCLETFGETNTGDPRILEDFLKWSIERYPAERYFLILWNHGGGWWEDAKSRTGVPNISKIFARRSGIRPSLFRHRHGVAAHANSRGICYDDTSAGDSLDNRELKDVLARACSLIGRKVDILGMDACLMNMVEVAHQLRDSVDYIVGSEIEEPNDGWPYTDILTWLAAKPGSDAVAVARTVVSKYIRSYKNSDEMVTQSALDVSRIGETTEKIDALAEVLIATLGSASDLIDRSWDKTPKFYDDNYIDLACFARTLRTKAHPEIKARAEDLLDSLKPGKNRAVLCKGKIGTEVNGTGGLSIYFPGGRLNPAYGSLDFAKDCRWIAFLEAYLS